MSSSLAPSVDSAVPFSFGRTPSVSHLSASTRDSSWTPTQLMAAALVYKGTQWYCQGAFGVSAALESVNDPKRDEGKGHDEWKVSEGGKVPEASVTGKHRHDGVKHDTDEIRLPDQLALYPSPDASSTKDVAGFADFRPVEQAVGNVPRGSLGKKGPACKTAGAPSQASRISLESVHGVLGSAGRCQESSSGKNSLQVSARNSFDITRKSSSVCIIQADPKSGPRAQELKNVASHVDGLPRSKLSPEVPEFVPRAQVPTLVVGAGKLHQTARPMHQHFEGDKKTPAAKPVPLQGAALSHVMLPVPSVLSSTHSQQTSGPVPSTSKDSGLTLVSPPIPETSAACGHAGPGLPWGGDSKGRGSGPGVVPSLSIEAPTFTPSAAIFVHPSTLIWPEAAQNPAVTHQPVVISSKLSLSSSAPSFTPALIPSAVSGGKSDTSDATQGTRNALFQGTHTGQVIQLPGSSLLPDAGAAAGNTRVTSTFPSFSPSGMLPVVEAGNDAAASAARIDSAALAAAPPCLCSRTWQSSTTEKSKDASRLSPRAPAFTPSRIGDSTVVLPTAPTVVSGAKGSSAPRFNPAAPEFTPSGILKPTSSLAGGAMWHGSMKGAMESASMSILSPSAPAFTPTALGRQEVPGASPDTVLQVRVSTERAHGKATPGSTKGARGQDQGNVAQGDEVGNRRLAQTLARRDMKAAPRLPRAGRKVSTSQARSVFPVGSPTVSAGPTEEEVQVLVRLVGELEASKQSSNQLRRERGVERLRLAMLQHLAQQALASTGQGGEGEQGWTPSALSEVKLPKKTLREQGPHSAGDEKGAIHEEGHLKGASLSPSDTPGSDGGSHSPVQLQRSTSDPSSAAMPGQAEASEAGIPRAGAGATDAAGTTKSEAEGRPFFNPCGSHEGTFMDPLAPDVSAYVSTLTGERSATSATKSKRRLRLGFTLEGSETSTDPDLHRGWEEVREEVPKKIAEQEGGQCYSVHDEEFPLAKKGSSLPPPASAAVSNNASMSAAFWESSSSKKVTPSSLSSSSSSSPSSSLPVPQAAASGPFSFSWRSPCSSTWLPASAEDSFPANLVLLAASQWFTPSKPLGAPCPENNHSYCSINAAGELTESSAFLLGMFGHECKAAELSRKDRGSEELRLAERQLKEHLDGGREGEIQGEEQPGLPAISLERLAELVLSADEDSCGPSPKSQDFAEIDLLLPPDLLEPLPFASLAPGDVPAVNAGGDLHALGTRMSLECGIK